jgi:membrane-associated protease RseP (regulator of RpoE activity)
MSAPESQPSAPGAHRRATPAVGSSTGTAGQDDAVVGRSRPHWEPDRHGDGNGQLRRSRRRPPEEGNRRSLVELVVVVVAVVLAAVVTHTTDLLLVIVALVVMIMLHELGHFATAKWSHMKVTEYFLGFGPRLWSIRKGETEYGIKAIPAGGYVKIVGMSNLEEVDPADEPRTYRQQPFHNRLLVAVAGSAMHALIALVLIWCLLAVVGLPTGVQVQKLLPLTNGSDPAQVAGLRPGDIVVAADGHKVQPDGNALVDTVGHRAGSPVRLTVWRDGRLRSVVVVPEAVTLPGKNPSSVTSGPGHIGVSLESPTHGPSDRMAAGPAVGQTFVGFGRTVVASVSALGQLFSAHGLSQYWTDLTNSKAATASEHSSTRIESIYGAVRTGVQGVQSGAAGFLDVMISINIFIGMLNMLPMLPLDGGHVAVAVYERIRSRRGRLYHADVRKLAPVAYVFVLLLGAIVVSAFYLDVTHPLANPFR